jgi:hypothetical protein
MFENKNLVIITLSVLLALVSISFVVVYNKQTPPPEPIVKTVVEEKIVYVEKDIKADKPTSKKETKQQTTEVIKEEIKSELPEVEVAKTEDNEYIITSTRDNNGRFTISLISSTKPPKQAFYDKKIILNSEIEADEYKGKFIFLVPPILLENISDLSIKITDAVSGGSHVEAAYCVDGIDPAYRYSMNISFLGGFSCYVQEIGEAVKLPKPTEESTKRMQDIFNKLQNNTKSKE